MNISSSDFYRRRQAGFTMVEILIICGIIALLSALLLSAFGQVRDKSRSASCASNLKQIGLACQMYAADNQGRHPNKPFAFGNSRCAWADIILPYTRSTAVFVCPSAINTPYIPGCGPDGDDPDVVDDLMFPIFYDGSYDMNALNLSRFVSETSFRHPSTTLSVLDGDGQFIFAAFKPSIEEAVLIINKPRHRGGNNVLFLDGHVKWLSADSLRVPDLYTVGFPSK